MDREHQEPPETDLRIGDTDVGRGVFVTRDFVAGEEILRFRGEVIDFATSLTMGERECDAFQIGPDVYLDLESPGVLINHSCDPNTGIREDIRLVALRDLQAGEEIRYDYSTTMDEDHWELECRCGSPRCRGIIRDFKRLPKDRKLRLLRQNIVPGFLITSELEGSRLTADEIEANSIALRGGARSSPRATLFVTLAAGESG